MKASTLLTAAISLGCAATAIAFRTANAALDLILEELDAAIDQAASAPPLNGHRASDLEIDALTSVATDDADGCDVPGGCRMCHLVTSGSAL